MNNSIIYNERQYKIALKELLVILKYIPKTDYEKIPKDVLKIINTNAEHTYNFNVDEKKSIKDQKISELTKAMLENFYRDYWVTDIEKNKIIEEENIKRKEIEEEKRIKYNPKEIFRKDNKDLNIKYKKAEKLSLKNVKEEKWYQKIFAFIQKIFNR